MTHLLRELQNADNLESINEIQFSLFSHQYIKKGSVADVMTPDTYDSNIPKNNGLFDHNMGSIDAAIICPTDEKKAELCPGYFGKIDLGLPVFNHHFVSYVEKVLKCVCFRCSNLLLDKSDPQILKELEGKKGYNRFVTCLAICAKNKKCIHNNGCFVLQPTKYVRLSGSTSINNNNIIQICGEFSQNALKDNKVLKQIFTPLICYQIFKKIKDEDVAFLGFSEIYSRPEWMIITSLAVPPPSVRPSVRQSDNQRSEDDLTYALANIVKANKLLKQAIENSGNDNKKIDNYQGYLQYLVSTYMDNEIPGVPQNAQRSSFRALKAITQRLKGKEGRLRGNIMGKRVDYSARTVISVDPNIDIDEFGVPQKIAMNLTFPEIVTQYNIKKLQNMVKNGPKTYPGAKTVTKTSEGGSVNISLKHVDVKQVADNLSIGDVVHRHLVDGDICLFNRQPTLHRMSMMSHRIKILPFSTFRLNVTVCKPYNADFDGDEMNMHIPQSVQTFTELEQICLVKNHIISPGTSTPCIEITQDTLLGAYLLTIQDVKLRRDQMNNYMMFSKRFNGNLPDPEGYEYGIPYWSGKQLYSLILPDININQVKTIKIKGGKITEGYLNNESLGNGSGGLIKQIYNAYGTETCNDFLNDTQKLITRWMVDNSFTIGFGDSTVNKEQRKMVREITNKYLEESFDLIRKAQHGAYANDLDDSYKGMKLENELLKILSNLSEKVKEYLVDNISKKNNFFQAGDKGSGSKGKTTNIQQIMGCVGQQDIWGSRIEDGFTERTLPHFSRNDVGPDAKGFCRNSFIEGLSPSEMFFHAMGGRTGTIDTAIKSVTGDTPIIIMERGEVKHVNIGDWIDGILDNNKARVQNLPEKEMELLELDYEAHIPTTDLDGNVSWGIIKNITRHDPGKELYEIKTHGGRNVIVTESHSLLIWNGKQYERKSTPEVKLGDFVPVTAQLATPPVISNGIEISYGLFINPQLFASSEIVIKNLIYKIYKDIGSLQNNNVVFNSESSRLLEDINVCLSRLGIFGIIANQQLIISNQWTNIFNEKIIGNKITEEFSNVFIQVNDTVLDAIVEINKVDISRYPKVYDLTIPSTLNFGLANGLHVVDTADSGYLSRKFIKAAEDLMVNYDFTVRNSTGHIVQFGYGDDNFDPIKLEKVTRIEMIEYDNKKMEEMYKFDTLDDRTYFENFMTKEAVDEMFSNNDYKTLLNDEYDEIMNYRNELRYNFFKNTEAIGDINTYIPINLYRVIDSQLMKFNVEPFHLCDITPKYIIETYNETMKDIVKFLPEKEENWKLFKIIFKSFLSTKRIMSEKRMSKMAFQSIILMIKDKMVGSLIHPGEMVGIIGAQTLGEISTQLTLNSVTYETEIIVRDANKNIKKVQIGDFIENEIKNSVKVDYMKDKDTTYAECANYYEVPSCTEDGEVQWKRIEAVTKHPVINKDGSNTMIKVTTVEEREVIATKAKSFLKLVNGKIAPIEGAELRVGDYLPVSKKQIDFPENNVLNLKSILSPTEYVYGSELEKAKSVMNEYRWWMKHANKTFVLPHKRSDTVVQLASDRVRKGRKSKSTIKDGNVYMLLSNNCEYNIPEKIELDYNFGYLVGAYCAEGCMTKHQLSISNNVIEYFKPIEELCKKWNITTKIYRNENKGEIGWTSQDLRIYNTVLCRILENLCGKLSHNKFVSDSIVFSNKTCQRGFLDAYIGGDGCIDVKSSSKCFQIGSVSKNMLIDVQQILNTFDIYSKIKKYKKQESNNRGSKDIKQLYYLFVNNRQTYKLAKILEIKIDYKQLSLSDILKHDFKYEYSKNYLEVPNEIEGEVILENRNERFPDVIFDKIKSIEEVQNTTPYAFDLTVEGPRTFNIFNGLCINDTFHLAGVGAGSLVITEGIPRLREIINITKNLKQKNMIIYLNEEYSDSKENARKVQSRFAYTQLKDILAKTEILYDNKDGNTDKNEDIEFIKSYKEFSELFDIDNISEEGMSPWILRLTFDKESLMNRKITIQEIQETIKENFHNDQEIDCIYSDDSVNDVIMRIKIKQDSKGNFLEFMKDFEKQLIDLSLRGVTNIKQVEPDESNIIKYMNDGTLMPKKEWVLKTSGSNLIDILADDAVDISRTITNDILEFHEIFGIEATRELIYRELMKVYRSNNPNPRHIQMLSDIMTYRGKLMQIDRHGLNKNSEIGPIAKASFEEVMNIFTKAALFAEKDNMKGVSANILAGQFCKSGTNCFEILIDEEKMLESVNVPDYHESEILDANTTNVETAFTNAYNVSEKTDQVKDDDFNFGFGIEKSKEYSLDKLSSSDIIIKNKENDKVDDIINDDNYEKIEIEEVPIYENNEVNLEGINIEEPNYENKEIATKKIKVKKVNDEKEKSEKKEKKSKKNEDDSEPKKTKKIKIVKKNENEK